VVAISKALVGGLFMGGERGLAGDAAWLGAAFGIDRPRQLSLLGKLKLMSCALMAPRGLRRRNFGEPDLALQHGSCLFPPCINRKIAATQQSQFRF
jgi:hypothetical protein